MPFPNPSTGHPKTSPQFINKLMTFCRAGDFWVSVQHPFRSVNTFAPQDIKYSSNHPLISTRERFQKICKGFKVGWQMLTTVAAERKPQTKKNIYLAYFISTCRMKHILQGDSVPSYICLGVDITKMSFTKQYSPLLCAGHSGIFSSTLSLKWQPWANHIDFMSSWLPDELQPVA